MSLTLLGSHREYLRGTRGVLMVAVAGFLLVAGIGAATSYLRQPHKGTGAAHATSSSSPRPGSSGEMLARLENYTRTIGTEERPSTPNLLPDVNTMIERLAARLQTTPDDIKGWRMLGWSYFNTGRYAEAAAAYARAVALDPNSADLRRSYEEAKTKASESASGADNAAPELKPPGEHKAVRSMVDGLADRLERSPRDVEGWTRLMRSRIVLGEREVAAKAFRKALEVFKDDQAATGQIRAAATELGLKAE